MLMSISEESPGFSVAEARFRALGNSTKVPNKFAAALLDVSMRERGLRLEQ